MDDLAEFGTFAPAKPETMGGARGCGFDKQLESASDDIVGITVAIRDSQGVDDVNDIGDGKQSGTVGSGRKAVQTSGNGGCIIALAVGENSRVDIGAGTNTEERACEIADAVAKIVEPKLPEG